MAKTVSARNTTAAYRSNGQKRAEGATRVRGLDSRTRPHAAVAGAHLCTVEISSEGGLAPSTRDNAGTSRSCLVE
jgi:hypothetical protein